MPGHYDTGAAPERTSQSSQYLEVEQRCYLIIVAIYFGSSCFGLAFCAWIDSTPWTRRAENRSVVIRHSLTTDTDILQGKIERF